ncbi:MAG: helix-turn-helix domain-containing protein [Firmicutes bacterium]|nr:helix-turn-helix domain-containing protein [Bacillota bacterium]
MDYLSEFGDSLKELMLEKDLTSVALSKAIKISDSTIGGWKNGEHFITLSNALKLADYFECSLEFLFGLSDTRLDYIPHACPPFYIRLKEIMKLQNISGYKISIKDRVFSQSQFYHWKDGKDPKIESLIKLAKYFDCTLDYLVGRDN